MSDSSDKLCFVIAPIGAVESETRKRSDKVFKHIIVPAVEKCGYTPVRADQLSNPGVITSQIINHILTDHLIVADLTDHNPNVFYELALCHAFKRPVVQMIEEGQALPFDVAGQRTIRVNHCDLDSAQHARDELTRQIKAVEDDPSLVDSPITTAVALESLKGSSEPMQKTMVEILGMVKDTRAEISELSNRLEGVSGFDALRRRLSAADMLLLKAPPPVSPVVMALVESLENERKSRGLINSIRTTQTKSEAEDKGVEP